MSIITTAQAVPSRLFSIYASIFDNTTGEVKDRLEAWATPPSLRTRGGDDDGEASTTLFSNTLLEARKLGLVEEMDDKLRIPAEARGSGRKDSDREALFRDHMLRILFDSAKADDAQQSGFMLALSWFLTLSPLIPQGFANPPQNQLRAELGGKALRDR